MSTAVAVAVPLPPTPVPSAVNPPTTEIGALYGKVLDASGIGQFATSQ